MSEWLDCPKCHAPRESGCACQNSKCEDFNGLVGYRGEHCLSVPMVVLTDELHPADQELMRQSTSRKVLHRELGVCLVTEDCLELQRTNPDTWTMFVEHDGEVKEVTKALVVEKDYSRAAGDAVCEWCGKKYCDHPSYTKFAEEALGVPFGFHQLCDGRVVKL